MSQPLSNIPQIETHLANRAFELSKAGISLHLKQYIDYGTQLRVTGSDTEGLICVYFSKKKGLSVVDCSKNPVSGAAIAIINGKAAGSVTIENHEDIESSFVRWIGTDESGKGDFFGPLVVCGFCCSRDEAALLAELGAVDSKQLDSSRIGEVAASIRSSFPDSFYLGELMPPVYNEHYARYGNLNTLLAASHTRILDRLHDRFSKEKSKPVDGAVVDMFGSSATFDPRFFSDRGMKLVHRQKGESNVAVAAASVIARAAFEQRMAELSDAAGMRLPFGAGDAVTKAARQFVVKHGREKLREFAKVHFATMKNI